MKLWKSAVKAENAVSVSKRNAHLAEECVIAHRKNRREQSRNEEVYSKIHTLCKEAERGVARPLNKTAQRNSRKLNIAAFLGH